ncbi:MAG: response regulator transcription factor [Crocinitomicaceae bacterium]|nr:response regulator transcription factor [Crocinitomicaceae bacterium]
MNSTKSKNFEEKQRHINIAIVDDQSILREALSFCLSKRKHFDIKVEAGNGIQLLENLENKHVDVVILDVKMPQLDGWQTLKILSEKHPTIKTIMLSMYHGDKHIIEAISLGARAYLNKSCSFETLVQVLYTVHNNGYYFDNATSFAIHKGFLSKEGTTQKFYKHPLSTREIQILVMICQGVPNTEMANKLCLSIRTIESHRLSLTKKTGLKNVANLVVYAIQNKLFDPNSLE